jgi:hypothetical protein
MQNPLNRNRERLNRLYDEKETNNQITKWKVITEGFKTVISVIERSGYYPTAHNQEGINVWIKNYLRIEGVEK